MLKHKDSEEKEAYIPLDAGFHTSERHQHEGVYFFETRDAPELTERGENGLFNVEDLLALTAPESAKLRMAASRSLQRCLM